jgi:hypothetical protein
MFDKSYIEYSYYSSTTMFWNKLFLVANIVEIYLIIDEIYYVVEYVFGRVLLKHDKNVIIEIKISTRNLQNMI